ncbi:hypothetical protein W02_22430 [Nitrospira sp. KM1]|uniref:DUF3562 domain-containing protein n=1 Tax=Nitrospira sp. KM1 TaxID=1936990 RepID=UPI0013A722E7|nr:DUF3562 domain-containing protein [Nitrospira sp. KM1]BCA55103.1 hypothetical protein W02_22430 [Nitrospira sp. KM1]
MHESNGATEAVKEIAEQFSRPSAEVHEILKSELCRLDREARIKQYIPILAIKQVKELMRRRSLNH